MQPYVIIFYQGVQPLTEADLKDRAAATRVWAATQNTAGHNLEPRILGPERQWCQPDGSVGPTPLAENSLATALLFLQANDITQAVAVARAHPALRYGASVEVRPWAPPVPQG